MESKKLTFIEDIPSNVNNLFFLLHGFASDNKDMMSLGEHFRKLLPSTALISVNAPSVADNNMGGYQWFSFKTMNVMNILKEIRQSYILLNNLIDEQLKRFKLPPENIFIAGFSQGAMMSLYTGVRREIAPMGIISFSGMMPDTLETLKNNIKSRPEVLLIHGTEDKTLPFESMRTAEKLLREFNIPCESHQIIGMEHEINNQAIEHAKNFIVKVCNNLISNFYAN